MKTSQHQKILGYMKKHGSITVREIQTLLDVNNGSARMSELNKKYQFIKHRVDYTKDDGTPSHYLIYRFSDYSRKVLENE